MAIKPSGMDYMDITPEDVVIISFEDNILESKRKPLSEYLLHKIFYEHRKDIKSIVHTHSTLCYNTLLFAVGFTCNSLL